MSNRFPYKSYCWSLGTTSFRAANFNYKIEKQLMLLDDFWKNENNSTWTANQEVQSNYYKFIKQQGFTTGDAPNPSKDARQKTSGLVDLGLLNDERRLSEVGVHLLKIAQSENFVADNFLELAKDSFIYFKQLLKTSVEVEGKVVRPFIVLIYLLSKLEYLSEEEFTYLLPLCIDEKSTQSITEAIVKARENNALNYQLIIAEALLSMENYKAALNFLQNNKADEALICEIGMNRKSPRYDKPYFALYKELKQVFLRKQDDVIDLWNSVKELRSPLSIFWKQCLFSTTTEKQLKTKGREALVVNDFLQVKNEAELKALFFKYLHVFKAKATLADYYDLNRRYFKVTDTVLFKDGTIKLDALPACYLFPVADELFKEAFCVSEYLLQDVDLEIVSPCLKVDIDTVYTNLSKLLGYPIVDYSTARHAIKDERYKRFNALLNKYFCKENLMRLLSLFEQRADKEIQEMVTDEADIPTIFEYIIAIIWYRISEYKGDVLEYMNLSLDADLLPKTHAGGGEADIVWKYPKTKDYGAHSLLIEVTLADSTNQRRMEMEPVSRHLGEYLLNNPDDEAYCIFVSTYLHPNLLSDFRARRNIVYYDSKGESYVNGMKILPFKTDLLRLWLEKDVTYSKLYNWFEHIYQLDCLPVEWYKHYYDMMDTN